MLFYLFFDQTAVQQRDVRELVVGLTVSDRSLSTNETPKPELLSVFVARIHNGLMLRVVMWSAVPLEDSVHFFHLATNHETKSEASSATDLPGSRREQICATTHLSDTPTQVGHTTRFCKSLYRSLRLSK